MTKLTKTVLWRTLRLTKGVLGRTLGMSRGMATMMGLAVLAAAAALTVGSASTAMAANGQALILGSLNNAATAITKLTGNVAGPSLQIVNPNTGAAARALDLQVVPGKPPITVNPAAGKATNLNVDKLDGKDSTQFLGTGDKAFNSDKLDGLDSFDFLEEDERDELLPSSTYEVEDERKGDGGSKNAVRSVDCDPGDKVLSGGGGGDVAGGAGSGDPSNVDDLVRSEAFGQGWDVVVLDNGDASFIRGFAICADFPPLR